MTRDLSALLQTMTSTEQRRAAEARQVCTDDVTASNSRVQSMPKPKGARVKFSPPDSDRK